MAVEHPSGALFVSGYGTPGQPTDAPPNLWKSVDAGKSWTLVDVGSPAAGARGNSDVDLAMASDGTLSFVTMTFDAKADRGPRSTSVSAATLVQRGHGPGSRKRRGTIDRSHRMAPHM
jgi:hypothetical protein